MNASSRTDRKPEKNQKAAGELIAGRYRVETVLGEGGMGTVLRVHDEQRGGPVALKRLHAGSERAKVALFEQEYFTLSELAHPRIIEVYDYGVDEGRAYYTMELLDGSDLRDLRGTDCRTVCAILCDVACSLAILHSRGLLHRDVSPRNVRRTADGRAKLIDFGAMTRMGSSRELVGTPPCVAPEVLQGQACDGRADLFALGVVLYWMLTGRYPYPARSFAELPDLWTGNVPTVSQLSPEVPAALAELVAELIGLEPHTRPRTAGEVVERLTAIGGFEVEGGETFAGAYLNLPRLVGRDDFVAWARVQLRAAADGRGRVLIVEGEPGVGLSRALRACVGEGKRLGSLVLTASAVDAGAGDYGVLRALARQLAQAMPDSMSLAPDRAVLEPLIAEGAPGTPPTLPERRHIQVAVRDWLIEVGKQRSLVIAVDDAEGADEPSLALLAMLAERVKKTAVAVVLALHAGEVSGLALEVLSRFAETFRLSPLSAPENEELVRSVFGDVGNVVRAAQTVHERARGNPRDVMAYLGHLVERGSARYEGAAWVLSDAIDDADLPSSIGAVLESLFAGLGPDAQQLARALALTDPSWLGAADYGALVGLPRARVFRATSALVSSRILIEEGSGHCFVGRAAPAWLFTGRDAAWDATVHARLADLAARRGEPLRRLHHLIESGKAEIAVDELLNQHGTEMLDYSAASIDLLERALAATADRGIPERHQRELRLRLVGVSAMTGDLAVFRRYAPDELAHLRLESGVDDWAALPSELSPGERLQTALARAHERHQATPELERGFSPFDALKRLARVYGGYSAMAGTASDVSLVESLPSLAPFGVLSPALAMMDASVAAVRALEEGRVVKARAAFVDLLDRLAAADALDPAHRDQMRYAWTYVAGSIDATYGLPSCLEFAAELEKVPKYRSAAWHMRRSYFRMLGKFDKARDCQRQVELLELRDGPQSFRSVNFRIEMVSSVLSDDVVGLKTLAHAVDTAAERLPRLRAIAQLSRAHYHRIRGEYALALENLTPILAFATPDSSIDWVSTATTHIELLVQNGRVEEACQHAERYLSAFRPDEHSASELQAAHTLALSAAGRHHEAAAFCDAVIANEERRGTRGLRLARCYQSRARIALAAGDTASFTAWANRFVEFCSKTESSSVRAQANRLTYEGRAAGVGNLREIELPVTRREGMDRVDTFATRLSSCGDRTERARLALSLAMETFGAERGHLFGLQGGSLRCLVSAPSDTKPEGITTELEELVAREHDDPEEQTQYTDDAVDLAALARRGAPGYRVRPLYSNARGEIALVGALALSEERVVPVEASTQVLKSIADALVETGSSEHVTGAG